VELVARRQRDVGPCRQRLVADRDRADVEDGGDRRGGGSGRCGGGRRVRGRLGGGRFGGGRRFRTRGGPRLLARRQGHAHGQAQRQHRNGGLHRHHFGSSSGKRAAKCKR